MHRDVQQRIPNDRNCDYRIPRTSSPLTAFGPALKCFRDRRRFQSKPGCTRGTSATSSRRMLRPIVFDSAI